MIAIFLRWLYTVCLALWMGGLIAIGAIVAPSAFHIVRINGDLAGNTVLQTTLAAGIVGESLRKFNILSDICGIGLIAASFFLLRMGLGAPRARLSNTGSMALTVITLGITLYLQVSLFPAMNLAQSQGSKVLFDSMHHRYEWLAQIQFPLLLLVALLAAVRDTPPRSSSPSTT